MIKNLLKMKTFAFFFFFLSLKYLEPIRALLITMCLIVFGSAKQSPLIIRRFATPNKLSLAEARTSECTFSARHKVTM